jgi:oligo-1,6-glucosidase
MQMDVINMISKVDGLPDAVVTDTQSELQPAGLLYVNGYEYHPQRK